MNVSGMFRVMLGASLGMMLALVCGCGGGGGDDSSSPTPEPTPVPEGISGTWRGNGVANGQTYSTTMSLAQSGSDISGHWDGYDVTATLNGSQLRLYFKPFVEDGVNFSGSGAAVYTGTVIQNGTMSLTGTYGGRSATMHATFGPLTRDGQSVSGIATAISTESLVRGAIDELAK